MEQQQWKLKREHEHSEVRCNATDHITASTLRINSQTVRVAADRTNETLHYTRLWSQSSYHASARPPTSRVERV